MDFVSNPGLLVTGAALILVGLLMQVYASRYDFAGMILSSIWQTLRGKRSAERPTEIEERLHEISSAPSAIGKARRLTGNVVGHFLAPIVGLISLIMLLAGAGFIAAAFYFS